MSELPEPVMPGQMELDLTFDELVIDGPDYWERDAYRPWCAICCGRCSDDYPDEWADCD